MAPKKSLADQIADLDTTAPKDYDPEDLDGPLNDRVNQESDAEAEEEKGTRDHYLKVGKSALRSQQFLMDDPRYSGKRTSRKDIYSSNDEEESDNEWQGVDDQDSANEEQDDEKEEEENVEAFGEVEDDSDEEEEEDNDEEEEEDNGGIKDELRKIEQDEKDMISQMSKSAQTDIEKGQHVKQQLQLWDNFLESRIRAQKLVEVANQLPQHDTWPEFLAKEEGIEGDLDGAKEVLREVIDEIMDLRTSLLSDNGTVDLDECNWNTRKRHLDDDDEYIEKLWQDISQINDVFVPFRNSTLEKWGNKVQAASSARLNKKFKAFDQSIMTQIDNTLADTETLVKRTQLQRAEYKILGKAEKDEDEEALVETGEKVDRHLNAYDPEIFDDNDFYQQQLRELIESRMIDTEDPIAMGMRWAARKQADIKKKNKVVDHKASKGRKLRFNVHEKLQNFMAPIPAGTWHEEMTDELYSSLLGQRKNTNVDGVAV
ncbi:apoptosis antagonizing transcription factor-domain-containing protein [Phycomyces nitens]|nr:apoptosis antagonizing transcription factor-domain-containing protein [Phycomyces nitens]